MNPDKHNIKFAKREGKIKIRAYILTEYQMWTHVCYVYNYGKWLKVCGKSTIYQFNLASKYFYLGFYKWQAGRH